MSPARGNWKSRFLLAAKLAIFAAVTAGVAVAFSRAMEDVRASGFSLKQLDVRWLGVAGLLYLVGLGPCWLFWHATLRVMGQTPTPWETFRAFYMGHLGKYVPGKAMVVVVRTGAVRSERTDTTIAAISVFVETLGMMAVGAFVAAAILVVCFRDDPRLLVLAVGLIICAGVPILPPVVRRLVRLLQVNRINPDVDHALDRLNYRVLIRGWLTIALGWCLMGLSLAAVLTSMPGARPDWRDLPLVIACLALSVVAGFASLIPGGLGMRELVAIALLEQGLGYSPATASISAVLLRLTWLLSEVVILIILYGVTRLRRRTVVADCKVQSAN